MSKDKEKEHGNWHHLVPRSRIPDYLKNIVRPWNKVKKYIRKHRAWHLLFRNRLSCEAMHRIKISKVQRYYKKKRGIKRYKLRRKERAWRTIFGDVFAKEAVEIIRIRWMPKVKGRQCFQFKECFRYNYPNTICPLLGLRLRKKKKKRINKSEFREESK